MGAPELHRSGHTEVDPNHAAEVAERRPLRPGPDDHGVDPVPPGNRPGAKPRKDQDKPTGPPPRTRRTKRRTRTGAERFDFRWDGPFQLASRALLVTPEHAYVGLDDETLTVRFGRWRLETPISNIEGVSITGPYAWWKVIGPPHISFKDRGLTFASTAAGGACIRFKDPVPAALPTGVLRHPAVTVTVEDPEKLADAIADAKRRLAA